jgi:hypothetical protein
MTGRITEGFDWLPAGASTGTMAALLQGRNWYLRGSGSQFGAMQGCSLVTGRFGYGQRVLVQSGSTGHDTAIRAKPVGGHTVSGYVSASINVNAGSAEAVALGVYDLVNDQVLVCATFHSNGVVRDLDSGGSAPARSGSQRGGPVQRRHRHRRGVLLQGRQHHGRSRGPDQHQGPGGPTTSTRRSTWSTWTPSPAPTPISTVCSGATTPIPRSLRLSTSTTSATTTPAAR